MSTQLYRIAFALLLGLQLAGCATSNVAARKAEAVWQVLNVVDTAQTVNIAKRPDCFAERDALTSRLIGNRPNTAEVLAVGLAYAWAHDRVSGWLDRKVDEAILADHNVGGWYVGRIAWHAVGLVAKTNTVVHNQQIGLRPFGTGCGIYVGQ